MNKNRALIVKMVGSAIFGALTIVLTYISNLFPIAGTPLNLGLIPIILAAMIYGPISGLFVGVVNGILVITGAQFYLAISVVGTILTCILKTGVAGFVGGYIYLALKNKNITVAAIVTALFVPICNTSIYIVGCLIFFSGAFGSLITIFVTLNFGIEMAINIVLSPVIVYLVKIFNQKYNKQEAAN